MNQWQMNAITFLFFMREIKLTATGIVPDSLDSLLIPSGDNAIPETDVGGKVRN